jgi:hypothetical protein
LTVLLVLAALVLGTGTATADPASCSMVNPSIGSCVIQALDPGQSGAQPDPPSTGSGANTQDASTQPSDSSADSDAGSPCFFTAPEGIYMVPGDHGVPCTSSQGSWSNELSCYLSPMANQPPAGDPAWEGRDPADGGTIYECRSDVVPPFFRTVWLADPPEAPTIAPGEVARMAVEQMDLQAIRIGIAPAPGTVGIVGLPTWLWVDGADATTFGPIARTASAGGVTVTATARVRQIDWNLGDGTTLTCATPGTPYQPRFGTDPSPDCGHTYTQDSGNQPGGVFTVSATSTWVVEWEGAGQQGTITLDGLTSEVTVTIGEAQVLVS